VRSRLITRAAAVSSFSYRRPSSATKCKP